MYLATAIGFFSVFTISCNSDKGNAEADNRAEPQVQSTEEPKEEVESKQAILPVVGVVGNSYQAGVNIAGRFKKGDSNNPSILRFYSVVTKSKGSYEDELVANLSQYTVEIAMISSNQVIIDRMAYDTHFPSVYKYTISGEMDFKITNKYPLCSKGYWIVGEEDGRPAIHEAFMSLDINFDSEKPKKVRMSYESSSANFGILTVSTQNALVDSVRLPCDSTIVGVGKWGRTYNKSCPLD